MKFDVYNLNISQNMGVWSKSTVFTNEQGFLFWRQKWKSCSLDQTRRVPLLRCTQRTITLNKSTNPPYGYNYRKIQQKTICLFQKTQACLFRGFKLWAIVLCKCTNFIIRVLYGYRCGFKAKFVAKRLLRFENLSPRDTGSEI